MGTYMYKPSTVYTPCIYGQTTNHGNSMRRALFTSSWTYILRKKLAKYYIWSTALYCAETWTIQKTDQKYLESFEMWCWKWNEISWTDHMRNEE
jgi:hypothetical protein